MLGLVTCTPQLLICFYVYANVYTDKKKSKVLYIKCIKSKYAFCIFMSIMYCCFEIQHFGFAPCATSHHRATQGLLMYSWTEEMLPVTQLNAKSEKPSDTTKYMVNMNQAAVVAVFGPHELSHCRCVSSPTKRGRLSFCFAWCFHSMENQLHIQKHTHSSVQLRRLFWVV